MNGGSSASYLARALFCALFNRGGNRKALRLPGEGGDHFHGAVEPSSGHIEGVGKNKTPPPKTRNFMNQKIPGAAHRFPEGPTIQKIQSRSKISISIEIFNIARKFQSRRLEFPTKNTAAVGGSLENFILARNFQSRSKSRIFLIFGPSGSVQPFPALELSRGDRQQSQ